MTERRDSESGRADGETEPAGEVETDPQPVDKDAEREMFRAAREAARVAEVAELRATNREQQALIERLLAERAVRPAEPM